MNNTATKTNSKFTIQQIAMIAVMTAVTCVLAPLSVPIGPVPISLTNLVIYFSLFILGTKKGTISYLIYLLIGLVGIPVFSGFTSGPGKLFGPTGGYLIGFIPLALIAGYFINHFHNKKVLSFLGMILGTAAVSYTHLDVYKRQPYDIPRNAFCPSCSIQPQSLHSMV